MDPTKVMQRAIERAEAGVAPVGVVAVSEMEDVRRANRRVLNLARSAAAQPLVARERISDRTRARFTEAGGKYYSVFYRLVGALSMVRRQLMRGVPEERHASLRPSAERRTMEEAPAIADRIRGDHLDDRRMPVCKMP